MQHRGSSDSRATADSHCAAQGSRNETEMSRRRSSRDVLLIWPEKLQERVKRVDTFVRDTDKNSQRRRRRRKMCLRFFQKWVRTAHPFKMTFLARKDELFLGRIQLQNWLASDHPGAYICMPQPRFGAKDVCYIEQKIGTKNATLGAASLYKYMKIVTGW